MSSQIPEPLLPFLEPPPPYTPGEPEFWQDPHISKGMLEAHLSPDTDAASRRPDALRAVAEWIAGVANLGPGSSLLDLGCGPGLYTQIWATLGATVTGLDLSPRSLAFAKEQADKANLEIEYVRANYLGFTFPKALDVITIIYCDFGALAPRDQSALLLKVAAALKPGGLFFFDVFSPAHLEQLDCTPRLSRHDRGFWSDRPYTELTTSFKFPEKKLFHDVNAILSEDGGIKVYRRWEHVYEAEDIQDLASAAGLRVKWIGSDLAGGQQAASPLLGVVLQKT